MRKFHLKRGERKLFLQKIAANLVMRGRMETTEARAKEIRPLIERMISISKRQNLSALRSLIKELPKKAAAKLYYEIGPRYKERRGGYLRITKLAKFRKRDGARMAVIEFV